MYNIEIIGFSIFVFLLPVVIGIILYKRNNKKVKDEEGSIENPINEDDPLPEAGSVANPIISAPKAGSVQVTEKKIPPSIAPKPNVKLYAGKLPNLLVANPSIKSHHSDKAVVANPSIKSHHSEKAENVVNPSDQKGSIENIINQGEPLTKSIKNTIKGVSMFPESVVDDNLIKARKVQGQSMFQGIKKEDRRIIPIETTSIDYANSKFSKTLEQIKQIADYTMDNDHVILKNKAFCGVAKTSEKDENKLLIRQMKEEEYVYDKNRVRLLDKTFICAAFIDGFEMKKTYIATQIPMENTCNSFWQMVYEHNICILVLMTEIGNPKDGVQYWPLNSKEIMKFTDYEIKFLNKSNIDGIDVIDIEITSLKEKKQRIVKQFCCPNMSYWRKKKENLENLEIKQDFALFLKFRNLVNTTHLQMNSETPKLITCPSGKGRSAAFIAIDIALKVLERHKKVDLYHIANKIRDQYAYAFTNKLHYTFFIDVIKSLAKN